MNTVFHCFLHHKPHFTTETPIPEPSSRVICKTRYLKSRINEESVEVL